MGLEIRRALRHLCRDAREICGLIVGADETEPTASESNAVGDEVEPEFAPGEPTDGRVRGQWKSRYTDREAQRNIRWETVYVSLSLVIYIAVILLVAIQSVWAVLPMVESGWDRLSPYFLAFLGGCLGGTLFSMKWLYHSVARGWWNQDRRLWRVFTPFLSGGAALAVVLLSSARVIPLFAPDLVSTNLGALGISVFLGYFSDRAFSGLERLAEQHLGSAKNRAPHDEK